jgi:transposase
LRILTGYTQWPFAHRKTPDVHAAVKNFGNALAYRQLASLAGVAPFNVGSGNHSGKRREYGGRAIVRRSLYLACVPTLRFNPAIRAFYDRLHQGGKPSKVAITACMRKPLTTLNAMIRNSTPQNTTDA